MSLKFFPFRFRITLDFENRNFEENFRLLISKNFSFGPALVTMFESLGPEESRKFSGFFSEERKRNKKILTKKNSNFSLWPLSGPPIRKGHFLGGKLHICSFLSYYARKTQYLSKKSNKISKKFGKI